MPITVADLRHTVVSSENEAFLLENNMIKNLQPRYNILLKDDKTYPWIVIRNEPFPRVQSTRRLVRDGSQYFGPYASVYVQKAVLDMAHGIHSLRTCSLNLSPKRSPRTVTASAFSIISATARVRAWDCRAKRITAAASAWSPRCCAAIPATRCAT